MTSDRKKSIAGWAFIFFLLLWAITYWYKDQMPSPDFYQSQMLSPPLQLRTDNHPFQINVNQQSYRITPLYSYELTGVVVSYSDADGFGNIWHHHRWKDFINVRDLCVIWQPNINNGVYQKLDFSSDSWTCWVSWSNPSIAREFTASALSNNHLLTDNLTVKKALMSAEIGDVISAKGMLVNYTNLTNGYRRKTSTTRKDGGQGACETIFLTDFKVIQKAHPVLRNLNILAFWGIWLALLEYLYFVFVTPHKARG